MLGGSEEGSGPSVSSAGPRPGIASPRGGGRTVPAPECRRSVRSPWESLAQPPHLSPGSALRLGGAWSGGKWGLGSRREGSHPCPACPWRPLGQFFSRQLLLQVPVFWRPRGAGVGGPQWGSGPPVFLGLSRLLFHLYLVAVMEGVMRTLGGPSPARSHPKTHPESGGTGVSPQEPLISEGLRADISLLSPGAVFKRKVLG